MKKLILIISLFILCFVNADAQHNIKDYLDYEFPDLKRHELIFDFGFFGDVNSSLKIDSIQSDNFSSNIENELSVSYIFTKNTRKYQGSNSILINGSHQFNKLTDNNQIQHKVNILSANIHAENSNRFYLKNKWFYEFNLNTNYGQLYDNRIFSGDNWTWVRNLSYLVLYPGVSIGKGRIEDISDVIHAVRLMKNFKENERIDDYPSPEKIKEFSQFITKLKNKRFFDSRHKKIYDLEQLDSFLINNHLINNKDIKYFTTLEDIWVFAGNYSRTYGSKLTFNLKPVYFIYSSSTESLNTFKYNDIRYGIKPNLSYDLRTPINVKLQSNLNINVGYSFLYEKYSDFEPNNKNITRYDSKDIFFNLAYNFNYYPNTRTVFESGISLEYGEKYDINLDFPVNYNDYGNLNTTFHLNCKYYISPQIRFFIDTQTYYHMDYIWSETFKEKIFRLNANFGFQISLK